MGRLTSCRATHVRASRTGDREPQLAGMYQWKGHSGAGAERNAKAVDDGLLKILSVGR